MKNLSFFSSKAFLALIMVGLFTTACDVLQMAANHVQANLPLTETEISSGLKEALKVGTKSAVSKLSAQGGFANNALLKLGLPKEAQVITQNLSKVPVLGDAVIKEAEKLINTAAEDAAKEAAPIFVNAITSMSISDALGILKGKDTSATSYLRSKTYQSLFNAFKPKIQASLSKKIAGNTSAESAYKSIIDKYNTVAKIPLSGLKPITQNTLSGYTTQRALRGLFIKVAEEEKNIRDNPAARVSDILKKVFGSPEANS